MNPTGPLVIALPAAGRFSPANADKKDEIVDELDVPKYVLFSNGLQNEKDITELHCYLVGGFLLTVLTTQTRGDVRAGDAADPADFDDPTSGSNSFRKDSWKTKMMAF